MDAVSRNAGDIFWTGVVGVIAGSYVKNIRIAEYDLLPDTTSKLTLFFITIIPLTANYLARSNGNKNYIAVALAMGAVWYFTQVPIVTCIALPIISALAILSVLHLLNAAFVK
jgi:hypothetical protein